MNPENETSEDDCPPNADPNNEWVWRELTSSKAESENYQRMFLLTQLQSMLILFQTGDPEGFHFIPINPSDLDAEGRAFRVYHIALECQHKGTVVFIRNENWSGVENWTVSLDSPPTPGECAEFSAKWYTENFGGIQADIFFPHADSIWSAGMGTNFSAPHSDQSCFICKVLRLPLYYVEVRLTNLVRYAFALEFIE